MSTTLDLLDDLMEDEDIYDAEAQEEEEEEESEEEEDIHVCGFCKEQFTDIDKFVEHKKSKLCRKSTTKENKHCSSSAVTTIRNKTPSASKPKRISIAGKPKVIRLNVKKKAVGSAASKAAAKVKQPKESTKEKENLVTITRSGRKATSWKTVKLEPDSEPEDEPDDIAWDIEDGEDEDNSYVGPRDATDLLDSETEAETPQRRKRGRPPGVSRGPRGGARRKKGTAGTKKPLHKSKLIDQNLKVISYEEYEKALRKYSGNVIVETENRTRHKIADKLEDDLLVANSGNTQKSGLNIKSESGEQSKSQLEEESEDQPAEVSDAELVEPEADTTVEVITESADGVVQSQVFTTTPAGPATVNKKVPSAADARFVTKVITTGTGPNGEIQTKVIQKQVYPCTVEGCSFRGSYAKDLKRHLRIHTGEKPYKCRICAKPFARMDKVRLHEKLHTGERPFKCEQCDYATVEKASLKKHMRKHTDERPYKCQVCPYRAKDSSQLTIHLRTHTGDCPYICWYKNCSASFKTNSDLKRHTRTHTGERPFACTYCTYRCSIKANLKNHIMVNHPSKAEEFHKCKVCDYTNRSKLQVLRHEKKHSKVLFICDLCEYNSKTKSQFLIHRRKRHGIGAKVLECELCDYTSTWEGGISSHMNKKHGGVGEKVSEDSPGPKTGTNLTSASSNKRIVPRRDSKRTIKESIPVEEEEEEEEEEKEEEEEEDGADADLNAEEGEEAFKRNKKAWLNKSNCIPNFVCPFCDAGFVRHDSYQSHLGQHKKQLSSENAGANGGGGEDAERPVVSNNLDVDTVPDLPKPAARLARPKAPIKAKVEKPPKPAKKPKILTKKQQKLLERQQQFAAQQQLRLQQQQQQRITTIVINADQNRRLNTTNSTAKTEVVLPLMPVAPSAPITADPSRPQQPSFFTPLKLEPPSGQVLTATAMPSTTMSPALLPAPPPQQQQQQQPQIIQTHLTQQLQTEGGVQYVITPVNPADQTLIQNVNEVQHHQVQQQHQTTTVVMQGGIVPTFMTR